MMKLKLLKTIKIKYHMMMLIMIMIIRYLHLKMINIKYNLYNKNN